MNPKNYITSIFIALAANLQAQLNTDSLYKAAQNYAAVNNYQNALNIARTLNEQYPANNDYKILMARIYSWQGNYNAAIALLNTVLSTDTTNTDALQAIVNTHLWAGNYTQVVQYSNRALANPGNLFSFFAFKKALALEKMQQNKTALEATDTILINDKNNKEAQALRTSIYQKNKNAVSLYYQNTTFNNQDSGPWQLAYLEYKYGYGKLPFIARANYGNMFSKSEAQIEADLYPRLSPSSYLYLNIGISEGNYIFPKIRGGAEYYKNFRNINASIGLRYFKFSPLQATIATGHIAYTIKNYELAYRPYLSLVEHSWYPSHTLSFKKSNYINETFLQIDIQYGRIPYNFFIENEFVRVNSARIGIRYQFRVKTSVFICPAFMYEYEEYYPGLYRNRFNTQIIFTKRF